MGAAGGQSSPSRVDTRNFHSATFCTTMEIRTGRRRALESPGAREALGEMSATTVLPRASSRGAGRRSATVTRRSLGRSWLPRMLWIDIDTMPMVVGVITGILLWTASNVLLSSDGITGNLAGITARLDVDPHNGAGDAVNAKRKAAGEGGVGDSDRNENMIPTVAKEVCNNLSPSSMPASVFLLLLILVFFFFFFFFFFFLPSPPPPSSVRVCDGV